jgi:PEGA domain
MRHLCLLSFCVVTTQLSPCQNSPTSAQTVQPQPVQTSFTSTKGFVLEDETPVRLRLNRTISSADAHVGDTVDFEVLDDITVNGTLVIPKGGLAFATVTEAQAKRRMARGGKLDINIDYVKLVNSEKAALRAMKDVKGGGHTGGMVGGMVATSLVFFPAAPFFLFMHGKDISIPKGTEITAYVNGDMRLDIAKFQPGGDSPADAAMSSSIQSPGSQSAKVQLESTPSGADIEVDGSFVGNTPSDLEMTSGEHTVLVKKTGFRDWERKLRVNGGSNVHLNAELERMTASDVQASGGKIDPPPPQQTQVQMTSTPAVPTVAKNDGLISPAVPRASIGATFDGNPDARRDGVTITAITTGGPADQAGILCAKAATKYRNGRPTLASARRLRKEQKQPRAH